MVLLRPSKVLLFRLTVTVLLGLLVLAAMKMYGKLDYTLKRKTNMGRIRPPVDCFRLFQNDTHEQEKAKLHQESNPKIPISNQKYINDTRDCDQFIADRDYITTITSEDERDFPLAFCVLLHKDVEMFERLLRAIYRPQNIYCVHVDKKSESSLHEAVHGISHCFDNVFVLQNNIEVTWGKFTILGAQILCMEALLKYKKWKYFINLTGQEFPLKTNWELVQILKDLNGSNVAGATIKRRNPERIAGRPPPPLSVTPVKGSVYIVVRREFVEYAINDVRGQMLLNWTRLVDHPDEMFYNTLNHNPQLGVPGSYLGEPETDPVHYPFINRYVIWADHKSLCHGKYVRSVCIMSVGDLPLLAESKKLFVNKFHQDYHPLAFDCLEELIYNRTQAEELGWREWNTSYYRDLNVTKNHI